MAGRLTPDDLARERMRQMHVTGRARKDKPMPPWMTRPVGAGRAGTQRKTSPTRMRAQEASEPAPDGGADHGQPPARKAAARKVAAKKAAAKKAAAKKAAPKKRAAKKSASEDRGPSRVAFTPGPAGRQDGQDNGNGHHPTEAEEKRKEAIEFPTMADMVGFIGLGVMGRPMAKNLLKRGFPLLVHSRSRGPVDELVAAGATAATTPAEVARAVTRIITMLPDGPDVEAVLTGPDGVLSAVQPGTIIVDMSTIAPATARRLAAEAAAKGATLLDAPVSGGEIGAIDGTLSIMVGGDAAALETVRPILEAMGNPERIIRIGDSGAGQICKACNQLVIGGTLAAVGEAFALARKTGVDPAKVRAALLGGFAASRVLEVHGQRMIDQNFKPGFPARLYRKDLRIVLDALNESHTPAPVTAIVQQLLSALWPKGARTTTTRRWVRSSPGWPGWNKGLVGRVGRSGSGYYADSA